MNWEKTAKMCQDTFGIHIDWEERFFICPECDEPIYECDWEDHNWDECPVCGTLWEEIE